MSLEFYWYLPTAGDGRSKAFDQLSPAKDTPNTSIRDLRRDHYTNIDYITQVARAAELTGFDGLIAPDDVAGEASWIVAGLIARDIKRPKIIAEFSPGAGSAVYFAKKSVTFQRYSGNRLGWSLATSTDAASRKALGDFITDADVPRRLEEFLIVSKGVAASTDFTFKGEFFEVLKGGFGGPLSGWNLPEISLSGETSEALEISAGYGDVHVFELGTADLASKIARLKALAASKGRTLTIALKARIFAHDDLDRAALEAKRAGFEDDAHTLTGDYDSLAEDLALLADLGVNRFQLFAPHSLETAYRIGEHVLPRIRQALKRAA
ncbi:LLM class flavin-dependent oxidoreductase [Asticcacaulis machinosus]|uniref:LLM class flavin-dependent oxidoreductase n=1 Tax=Asticcacaulis machinosus TaxID=2984211 RepID=A0ABT5HJF0_9CAUL|nr:LLM class flavin-dependent oxidoreductase [Asticcacaulis machinosus]MDC7676270.1 LLM class flavin-dependent oxidoreductase [Asticcacaulis machinosus]